MAISPEAMHAFIVTNNNSLLSYVFSHWARNPDDAREIVQEVYLRMYSRCRVVDVEHMRGMAFKIAQNLAIDWFRRGQSCTRIADAEALRMHDCGAHSPEEILIGRENYTELQEAVAQLPTKSQQALRWLREDGLTYQEIATRMGIRIHSARRLVERATDRLHELKGHLT